MRSQLRSQKFSMIPSGLHGTSTAPVLQRACRRWSDEKHPSTSCWPAAQSYRTTAVRVAAPIWWARPTGPRNRVRGRASRSARLTPWPAPTSSNRALSGRRSVSPPPRMPFAGGFFALVADPVYLEPGSWPTSRMPQPRRGSRPSLGGEQLAKKPATRKVGCAAAAPISVPFQKDVRTLSNAPPRSCPGAPHGRQPRRR